jgi:hypothetical protein
MRATEIKPGERFGRLTVLAEAAPLVQINGRRPRRARVRCICGSEKFVQFDKLKSGHTRSCGCLFREVRVVAHMRHGDSAKGRASPEYHAWRSMRRRCSNPRAPDWKNYGGRGIKVCERWDSYECFLADMGRKPSPKHSIDRINNDGNYEPENCRWATAEQRVKSKISVRARAPANA